MQTWDIIVIGSGLGGLVAASLLARHGKKVLVCESHSLPGGAAHAFHRNGFTFDSGPSFYCGLADGHSCNPIREVLQILGESIETIPYDPLGHYHFPEGTVPVYGNADKYRAALTQISPNASQELAQLEERLFKIYAPLRQISTLALRADWQVFLTLIQRYPQALVKLLPQIKAVGGSMGDVMRGIVTDPWLRRLLDLECFLLSGLTANDTVAPEMAFMFGERSRSTIDYPVGGSGAIVAALIRGLTRWGGSLRLKTHVDKILVENNQTQGVLLKSGEQLTAPTVISNATVWDTYNRLLVPGDLPKAYRQKAMATPAVESFMHLHLGIKATGLTDLTIHHVVVHDSDLAVTTPGNTCMISIPSVLDPNLAPPDHHVIHAYTLESWQNWQPYQDRNTDYKQLKQEKAKPLYRAIQKVIPDICDRIDLELIGTPLTHQRFLRRHQGTYGPAIAAGQSRFPSCKTPIEGLYRVGDSTVPGIGVPAVAASGILCANSLVSRKASEALLDRLNTPITPAP